MTHDVSAHRTWYARDLGLRVPIRRNLAIIEAFAAVPRERFLGKGPWRIMSEVRPDLPFLTPDDNPAWLYHDVLVSIDAARGLNNGMPSFWAGNFDALDVKRGQRVLQVGAGVGYYTAILAELVGPEGHVTAVEYDQELAARARDNLSDRGNVEVIAGDGCAHDAGPVDLIVVFAGSTQPAPLWLERLTPGGQLLMPLTPNRWSIGLLLLARRPSKCDEATIVLPEFRDSNRFEARSIGGVRIFPCVGNRDEAAAQRLEQAIDQALRNAPRGRLYPEIPICALHCGEPGPGRADRVWYAAPGFWLERKAESAS